MAHLADPRVRRIESRAHLSLIPEQQRWVEQLDGDHGNAFVGMWLLFAPLMFRVQSPAAAAMLVMIPLTLDEVVAMLQFLRWSKKRGTSYWHAFSYGGTPDGTNDEAPGHRDPSWRPAAMFWGVSATWQMLVSAALGVWLMFSPAIFNSSGAMADSNHLIGAVIIVFSVIAMGEVGKPMRYLNLPLGAWLIVAPWFLSGVQSASAPWNAAVVGVLVSALSFPVGKARDHYGRFDRIAFWGGKERRAHAG